DAEAVLGTDRDVDLFFPVPVHVAEQEVLRPVGGLLPAFVRGRDVLAFRVRQRLRGGVRSEEEGEESRKDSPPQRTRRTQRLAGSSVSSVSPVVESSRHCCGPPVFTGAAGKITLHSG